MSIWAIIPVKQLFESKRRLAHLLTAEKRAALIHQFLDNLLIVLTQAPSIDHTLVVTADPMVVDLARAHRAKVLIETRPDGLNNAVERGLKMAESSGATAILILPADLPFARVDDIEQMVARRGDNEQPLMAICGDEAESGTNALLLAPPGDFTFRYGPDSFQAHLDEAAARGRLAIVTPAPGLRFDLDTESDWLVYNGFLVQVADE